MAYVVFFVFQEIVKQMLKITIQFSVVEGRRPYSSLVLLLDTYYLILNYGRRRKYHPDLH